jgi:hypothetical protein
MTKPKLDSELKQNRNSRELIYNFVVKANREIAGIEVRSPELTVSTAENMLRKLCVEGVLVRRQVRSKPKGRVFWAYRKPDMELNPVYVDANDPSVVSTPKPRRPAKKPPGPDFRKIMKNEPSNYKILRDLPKGSEQVVGELYLADYYDTSSPNYLEDLRA